MHVRFGWLICAMVVLLALVGCGGTAEDVTTPSETTSTAVPADVSSTPDGLEAMPTDGPGESAALAAVPAALEDAEAMRTQAGLAWPDLTGLEPRFVAYLVRSDYDGQVALFEVHADGIAHNLYAYQKAFDSGSIVWTSAENSQGPTAAPQSDPEQAAVASVESAMADAFPNEPLSYAVHGYRFVYLDGDTSVLTLEIDPAGGVISVGD